MKKVAIIIPETAIAAAIVDPRYMFTAVNQFFSNAGHQPFFEVKLVGLTKEIKLNDGLISIFPDLLIDEVEKADLIIIPAISGDIQTALELNQDYIPWIVNQYKKGAEVASLCIGAFLLAATGLLDGKICSTHWLFANDFRNMFPTVNLTDDKIITEQNGLYSSGGASSYWNLLLYLVEKYTSKEMAIIASKFFLLDIGKTSQSPFAMFSGQKEHSDLEIVKVQEYIESNFSNKLTVDDLAVKFGIGRRTLERRFKNATTNTILEYLQRVKTEAAKKQLESGRKTVNEIMFEVGYSDLKAFREVFRKYVGMSPLEYKNKFSN